MPYWLDVTMADTWFTIRAMEVRKSFGCVLCLQSGRTVSEMKGKTILGLENLPAATAY